MVIDIQSCSNSNVTLPYYYFRSNKSTIIFSN